MPLQVYPHIISDPDILAGQPVIEGTRIPASTLVEQVATGKSLDDVARAHGVTSDDVRAALEFAAQRVSEPVAAGSSVDAGESAATGAESQREPVTELGRRLAAIRKRIIASGTPLLSWDELDTELDEMRRHDLDV